MVDFYGREYVLRQKAKSCGEIVRFEIGNVKLRSRKSVRIGVDLIGGGGRAKLIRGKEPLIDFTFLNI